MIEDVGDFCNIRVRSTQPPTHQGTISTRKNKSQERQRFEITACEVMQEHFKALSKE